MSEKEKTPEAANNVVADDTGMEASCSEEQETLPKAYESYLRLCNVLHTRGLETFAREDAKGAKGKEKSDR